MKLIEKLAHEYSWTPEQQRHWMEGFRKAREMAAELTESYALHPEVVSEYMKLGEEEV